MKKLALLTITAAITAMMAIPAIASAGEWDIDSEGGVFPLHFSSAGGAAIPFKGSFGSITCTANTGAGDYETATTGTFTQTFTGCKDPFGGTCQSGGTAGTIVTFALPFHNIMIEATNASGFPKGTPGILITPNPTTGDFATVKCNFIGSVTFTGNGLIADIAKPECGGAFATTATLKFEEGTTTGQQKWRQITTTGTEYDLKLDIPSLGIVNGTSAQISESTVTYKEGTKTTCP